MHIQFDDSSRIAGKTINLSTRGLSCRVPCYVPPFTRISISLAPTAGMTSLRMDALVVRTEKQHSSGQRVDHLLGLFFLHLDQEKARAINHLIAGLEEGVQAEADHDPKNDVKPAHESCLTAVLNPQRFLQDYNLTRLDRLACLGELSTVLAHEIKNPLACLAGSLQILGDEIREKYPSEALFTELFGQIERIDNIVDHLLQFSANESLQTKRLRLEDVISGTLGLLGGKLKEKNIRVDLCHGADQPLVAADERLLRQAFLNIFANLIDSVERNGSISVNTYWKGKAAVCDRSACECFAREEDKGISIIVMNSRVRNGEQGGQDLQPLSLAERKKRGLNLSLTQQIIEQHDGRVYLQNQNEPSSVLLVTLPL